MKTILNRYLVIGLMATFLSWMGCGEKENPAPPPPAANTFVNPLRNGADPWVIKQGSSYYYTQTMGNRVAIWKTDKMSALAVAPMINAFTPLAGAPNSANLWAPEIHFLDNKWYIYYTAGSGPDNTQRTWVLENTNADPMTGAWVDKGRIFTTDADFWAIDGNVMQYNGENYFVWSGRPNINVQNQNLYIAKMVNPWTLATPTATISLPTQAWEMNGGPVNEAPQHLVNNGKHFIVYSASGCWTDDYALGYLQLKDGGNPLVPADWTKSSQAVFTKRPAGNAYGPGHNAFFQSADGTENWIIYHANSNSNDGCSDRRTVRMQEFTYNADGTPNFGVPVSTGAATPLPSGE